MDNKVRIARQPIVTAKGEIYAYELLFRDFDQLPNQSAEEFISDNHFATSRVIVNALNQFGIQNLVGDHIAFINTDVDFLMDDGIFTIPPHKFIIEVLEHVTITEKVIERIKLLKEKGYCFALDDASFKEDFLDNFEPLLEYIDVLKLDISLITPSEFTKALPRLKKYKFQILAEKVETQEDFHTYEALGCTLFQGYFFAKPEIKEQTTLDAKAHAVLKLLSLLNEETAQTKLISEFEMAPEISLQLLRYLNSSAVGLSTSVKSIPHALTLVGKVPLKSWLLLISFSSSEDAMHDPLFEMARSRSLMMSHLATACHLDKPSIAEASFIGLLSLLESIFKVPLEVIMNELNLDAKTRLALTSEEGTYGECLHLVKIIENMDLNECKIAVEKLGILPADVQNAIVTTYSKLSEQDNNF